MEMHQLNDKRDSNYNMSWNDFVRHCRDFVAISDGLNDDWIFHNDDDKAKGIGESYLMKKTVKHLKNDTTIVHKDDCGNDNVYIINDATYWEYHILYSPSYCVPTLYFNAWKRDGSILTIDEITELQETSNVSSVNKICVFSQQEHPLLHRPFYYIHPCDTAAILQSCRTIMATGKSVNPITTWLSTVASVAQIDLPSEYAC